MVMMTARMMVTMTARIMVMMTARMVAMMTAMILTARMLTARMSGFRKDKSQLISTVVDHLDIPTLVHVHVHVHVPRLLASTSFFEL